MERLSIQIRRVYFTAPFLAVNQACTSQLTNLDLQGVPQYFLSDIETILWLIEIRRRRSAAWLYLLLAAGKQVIVIETLDKCFSHDTVEEIVDALETEAAKKQDAWCVATSRKLQETSPLSLKVSLRSIRQGRHQTLDQCLRREYRMSLQALYGQISSDFCEGVRSRLVDRDLAPKWDPPSLEKVTDDMVDQYFSRLTASEPELELPTQQREAFT
ncbi:hypothetical protein P3S67_004170 [Capsicum chacoense]